jgi:hypothetical protein
MNNSYQSPPPGHPKEGLPPSEYSQLGESPEPISLATSEDAEQIVELFVRRIPAFQSEVLVQRDSTGQVLGVVIVGRYLHEATEYGRILDVLVSPAAPDAGSIREALTTAGYARLQQQGATLVQPPTPEPRQRRSGAEIVAELRQTRANHPPKPPDDGPPKPVQAAHRTWA